MTDKEQINNDNNNDGFVEEEFGAGRNEAKYESGRKKKSLIIKKLQRVSSQNDQTDDNSMNRGNSQKTLVTGKEKLKEENKHDEMVKLIDNMIYHNILKYDKEILRKWAHVLNEIECKVPLTESEINTMFENSWNFVGSNKKLLNSTDVPQWQIKDSIREELEQHHFSISNYEPMDFIIAHRGLNQIVKGYIGKKHETVKDENGKTVWLDEGIAETKEVPALRLKNPIIDAIPIGVTKFDDGIHLEYRYSIRFNSHINNKAFTTQTDTIEGIVQELKGKGMVVGREPNESLAKILGAMEKTGSITLSKNIQKRGFWLIDGKLESYDVEIKRPTDDQIKECIELLEELYNKVNVKSVFSTTIKWGIVSPFSFVMKSYGNWMNWIHKHGFTNCGKTFGGTLVLAMWRLGEEHNISFESISSVPRFGERLSQNTFPIVINEAGALSDEKHKDIVEMIKSAIEQRIARSLFKGNRYIDIDSLRSCIITANPAPPNDAAYKRKMVVVTFGENDIYDEQIIEAFNDWFRPKKSVMGTLGDFAADYIMKNPETLKEPWNNIGIEVLKAFYSSVGKEAPQWIDEMVERVEISDSIDDAYLNTRSYLTGMIIENYSRYSGEHGEHRATSVIDKLDVCCDQHLIPSIEKHKDCYVITQAIMHKLRSDKYDGYVGGSLKGFAGVLKFEYGSKKVGGKSMKVAYCSFEKMAELLSIVDPFLG